MFPEMHFLGARILLIRFKHPGYLADNQISQML